jgi:hypothetical protein
MRQRQSDNDDQVGERKCRRRLQDIDGSSSLNSSAIVPAGIRRNWNMLRRSFHQGLRRDGPPSESAWKAPFFGETPISATSPPTFASGC